MITALLIAYLFGGGAGISASALTTAGVKQLSKQAETVITEPARADEAQEVFTELRKNAKAFEKMFAKTGRQLTKSYKNHAADRDEALAIFDDINSGWEASQQRALDLRFELKGSLTEQEWAELFATE